MGPSVNKQDSGDTGAAFRSNVQTVQQGSLTFHEVITGFIGRRGIKLDRCSADFLPHALTMHLTDLTTSSAAVLGFLFSRAV